VEEALKTGCDRRERQAHDPAVLLLKAPRRDHAAGN
jgi:hypothetical protein